MVLPKKRLATIARCTLESADTTHRSRFLSAAPWPEDAVNHRRIRFMLQQTKPPRRRRRASLLARDETRCEPGGSWFDSVDRPDNHCDGTDPLAHHPVTSLSVSGAVRRPVGVRLYRRDEALTQGEANVAKHVPDVQRPTEQNARHRRDQQVDPWCSRPPSAGAACTAAPKSRWRSHWGKRRSATRYPLAWGSAMPGTWPRTWSRSWPGGARTGSAC